MQVTLPAEEEDTDSEAEEQARMMGYHQEEEEEEDNGAGDQPARISRPRVTAVQRAQSEIQPDTSSGNTRAPAIVQRSMSETRR